MNQLQQMALITMLRKSTQLGLVKSSKKYSTNTLTKWMKVLSRTWSKSSISITLQNFKKTI